jgi:plastocyanin
MKTQVVTILTLIIAGIFVTSAIAAGKGEAVESLVFPESYEAGSVSNGGTITGTVTFEGEVPTMKKLEITKNPEVCGLADKFDESVVVGEGNGLKNAIIYLMDISSGAGFLKGVKVKYELDQKGCHFSPHVRLLPVGQRLTMLNPDKIMHNVHIFSKKNTAVNKSQPGSRRKMPVKAVKKAEGPVPVKCDVHGWMKAWIAYIPHPYFAASDENGQYKLENVPPGTYKLGYWHESCGTNTESPASVTVDADGAVTQDFALTLKN